MKNEIRTPNNKPKTDIQLVDNNFLKKISQKKYYIQPTYTFLIFVFMSIVLYYWTNDKIVQSLSSITTANVTLFAVNLALLIFIVPYFINDKIKHLEYKGKINELRIQGKVRQPHLEQLKKIDIRIVLDSQTLNSLFFQTILLIVTFCISVVFLAFGQSDILIAAVSGSHIIVEISYILNLIPILGIYMYTKDLDRLYADMITEETNLLRNDGCYVHVFTNKELKEIRKNSQHKKDNNQ